MDDAKRERLFAFETFYSPLEIRDLMAAMVELAAKKETLDEQSRLVAEELDYLRLTKIPALCEDQGVESMAVQGLGRLSLTADLHVSIRSGQGPAAQRWLQENGLGDLIREAVNPSTLKATIKRRIKDGESVPDEFFNVHPFTRAAITRT